MGASDRDYWRTNSAQSGFSLRQSKWSATTWIIGLCIAVFVIDGFLPRQWVVVASTTVPGLPDEVKRLINEGKLKTTAELPAESPSQYQSVVKPVSVELINGGFSVVATNTWQSMPYLQKWLYFSTSTALYSVIPGIGVSGLQVWRFIGFQFCHAGLWHLVFNMMALYFFGPIVERYLGAKRYCAFYLICGIAGALFYLILNFAGFMVSEGTNGRVAVPGLLSNDPDLPLIGASAGVFGIIIAAAHLMPNAQVLLFFVIPIRLKTLAYGLVAIALASVILKFSNAGGEAAHIGGAIAGWYFIQRPERLRNFFDFLGRVDPTSTFHASKKLQPTRPSRGASPSNAEVDRILDKVRASGLASLNESERRALRDATDIRSES